MIWYCSLQFSLHITHSVCFFFFVFWSHVTFKLQFLSFFLVELQFSLDTAPTDNIKLEIVWNQNGAIVRQRNQSTNMTCIYWMDTILLCSLRLIFGRGWPNDYDYWVLNKMTCWVKAHTHTKYIKFYGSIFYFRFSSAISTLFFFFSFPFILSFIFQICVCDLFVFVFRTRLIYKRKLLLLSGDNSIVSVFAVDLFMFIIIRGWNNHLNTFSGSSMIILVISLTLFISLRPKLVSELYIINIYKSPTAFYNQMRWKTVP